MDRNSKVDDGSDLKHLIPRRKTASSLVIESEVERNDSAPQQPRYFRGLRSEIMRRYPQYWSDITDAANVRCFATVLSVYFAAVSGALTFGALLDEKSEHLMGISETLVVSSLGGMIFALTAGQPLLLIGLTGPMLQFDDILKKCCATYDIDFLGVRIWAGFTCVVLALVVLAFGLVNYVRYFTRFAQDIFSSFVSFMFLTEATNKLRAVFANNPLQSLEEFIAMYCRSSTTRSTTLASLASVLPWENVTTITTPTVEVASATITHQPNTALLGLILMTSTFVVAAAVRNLKTSSYLSVSLRNLIGDFAIPIGIMIPLVLVRSFASKVYTQKLSMPDGFPTSAEGRGWMINPLGHYKPLTVWHCVVGIIGGFVLFGYIFLQVELCEIMMAKKERKTRKGTGHNLDLLIICMIEALCALIGGPWVSAAAVRCLAHVNSLSVTTQPDNSDDAPQVVRVYEQRVTGFLISLLIGASIFISPWLRQVPIVTLFGVFFYMGYTSFTGTQFFERLLTLFKPRVNHPPNLQAVPYNSIVKFTFIQLICLVLMLIFEWSGYALFVPLMIICLVPVRHLMKYFFTENALLLLDGEPPVHEQTDTPVVPTG